MSFLQARQRYRLVVVQLLSLALLVGCAQPSQMADILQLRTTLKVQPTDAVMKLAVSPNGEFVAGKLFTDDHSIMVWDTKLPQPIHRLHVHRGGGMTFSRDGMHLLAGDWIPDRDASLLVRTGPGPITPANATYRLRKPEERFKGHRWDVRTGRKLHTYYYQDTPVCSPYEAQFNRDGSQFLERGRGEIRICDATSLELVRAVSYAWEADKEQPQARANSTAYLDDVQSFAFPRSWQSALLVTNRRYPSATREPFRWGREVAVLWFDLESGAVQKQIPVTPRLPGGYLVKSLTLSMDGQLLAVGTWYYGEGERQDITRARVTVLDTASGAILRTIDDSSIQASISAVAITDDDAHVIVAGDRISLWEIASGRKVGEFADRVHGKTRIFSDLKLSSDGRTLVAGGGDKIYVWAVVNSDANRSARD